MYTENLVSIEKEMLSFLVQFPGYRDWIGKGTFVSREGHRIYDKIVELADDINNTEPISYMLLKRYLPSEMDENLDEIAEFKHYYFDDEDEIFKHINSLLYEANKNKIVYRTKYQLKEVNDLINMRKFHEAQEMLQEITILDVKGILPMKQLLSESLKEVRYFKSGTSLDSLIGELGTGTMLAMAGEPGTMKTYFSMWYIFNILENNPDFIAVYFEKEMPASDIALRMLAYIREEPLSTIYAEIGDNREEKDILKYSKSGEDLLKRFIVIPGHQFNNAHDIGRYIRKYKANIYCIDYVQLMAMNKDMNLGTMQFMTELKNITIATKTFGILLSQVNNKEVAKRKVRISKATDMQYGSVIEQHCSQIVTLFCPNIAYKGLQLFEQYQYSPEDYFVFAQKSRNSENYTSAKFYKILKNGFFNDIVGYYEMQRMSAWLNKYTMQKEDKRYS